MQIQTLQVQRRGRTFILVEATARSPATRVLLQRFKREVSALEKKWRAAARAAAKRRGAGAARRARRRR
jgi:hypothetical protein